VSDESKDVEDEVADRGKFIYSMRTAMYSHSFLERTKQKLLEISSIEQFVMILSGKFKIILTVLQIRDVYPRSRIRIFSIPDPVSTSKNLSILTQKIVFKLSENDPGCSSRIRKPHPDPVFYPSRIPDSMIRKAPDPGSATATLNFNVCTKQSGFKNESNKNVLFLTFG
jgi:hypothetical protein